LITGKNAKSLLDIPESENFLMHEKQTLQQLILKSRNHQISNAGTNIVIKIPVTRSNITENRESKGIKKS